MKNLKESRIRAGLSQRELAEKIGVSTGLISHWECERAEPNSNNLQALKAVLDLGKHQVGDDVSPIAEWLKKARSEKDWSIPELAHNAGLTPPSIYRIEAGRTRNVREDTRRKIEKALDFKIPDDTAREVAQEAKVEGLGALEDFDPHDDNERPQEPGIYVLYDISERPIYAGEGSNVRRRIKDHEEKFWFKRPIVESASWIKITDGSLRNQIETLLIKFLKSNAVINKQNVERG